MFSHGLAVAAGVHQASLLSEPRRGHRGHAAGDRRPWMVIGQACLTRSTPSTHAFRDMPTDGPLDLGPDSLLRVIGTTELLPSEVHSPSFDPWRRALAIAEAQGRVLAAGLRADLGGIQEIEQLPSSDSELVVGVTFRLARDGRPSEMEPETAVEPTDDILDHVPEQHRALYASFREQVLGLDAKLLAAPAPLRKGKRRYEGFRLRSRRIIYAGFRARGVRLMFELPKAHGLAAEEFVTRGRRDWRLVMLTSPNQLKGAVSLAEDTVRAFKT